MEKKHEHDDYACGMFT